jgi:hypothetical protein
MNRISVSHTHGTGGLAKAFIDGVSWPIDRASLEALSDIGLSPQQIARYFSVPPAEVRRLLDTALAAEAMPTVGLHGRFE